MKAQRHTALPQVARTRGAEPLKDEVYRQMYRVESNRSGAEVDLALALLRAWTAADAEPPNGETRQWLRKVCPICMEMIEAAEQPHDAA